MKPISSAAPAFAYAFTIALPLLTPAHAADFSPRPEESQLPRAMHSAMKVHPSITVGVKDAEIVGDDNRALQAAVDYIGKLGGGTVEIGPGDYLMHDSLHLRSHVTVRGTPGKSILRKAKGAVSPLAIDGDYGEEQITVANPDGFKVGYGVTIRDDTSWGFHTTVARIIGSDGNTFAIDTPLNADCLIDKKAMAATIYPVVSGYYVDGVHLQNLIIEGNKDENTYIDGCRGGGIFLYRGFGAVIENCVVRNYNGDGISFQQSNDVQLHDCISEGNLGLGFHPGSGSQRPVVRENIARLNGQDGLYLCWRVRHGLFEKNILENNGRYGISIGHKDSDNLLTGNEVRGNEEAGVYFRNETLGMAGHRNRLENNVIENNGDKNAAPGIQIRGETRDLVFRDNIIRDTRPVDQRKQTVGIRIEKLAGPVVLEGNQIDAPTTIEDERPAGK
jgi:parallel beta-helix repeat protein